MAEVPEKAGIGAKEKEIVSYAAEKGAIIEPAAVKLLVKAKDYKGIVDELLGEGLFVINERAANRKIVERSTKVGAVEEEVSVKRRSFKARAAEVDAQIRVMKEYDVTGQSSSEGGVKAFIDYFRDKFELRHKHFFSKTIQERPFRNSSSKSRSFLLVHNFNPFNDFHVFVHR